MSSIKQINFSKRTFLPKVRVNGDCDKGRGLDYYKHFKCNEKLADQTSILKTDGEKTIDTRYIRPFVSVWVLAKRNYLLMRG